MCDRQQLEHRSVWLQSQNVFPSWLRLSPFVPLPGSLSRVQPSGALLFLEGLSHRCSGWLPGQSDQTALPWALKQRVLTLLSLRWSMRKSFKEKAICKNEWGRKQVLPSLSSALLSLGRCLRLAMPTPVLATALASCCPQGFSSMVLWCHW